MSTSNYPVSPDDTSTLPNPTTGSNTNSPSHAALHTAENDAIKALEAKLGTGATTPAANKVLLGTGTGTTAWGQLSSSQLISVLTDETGTGYSVFNNAPTLVTPKVDTINESTTDNGVTIDGLNIKDGILNSANSVASSNIQAGAVEADNIADNAITLGYIAVADASHTGDTNDTLITGASLSVLVSNARRIDIHFSTASPTCSATAVYKIWRGSVGSGTVITQLNIPPANSGLGFTLFGSDNPGNGTFTYTVSYSTSNASDAVAIAKGSGFSHFKINAT